MARHTAQQATKWRPSKQARVLYRMAFCMLIAAFAVRMIMVGLGALGERTGLPGGEIFIPLYILLGPVFGWQMRGWQEPPKRKKGVKPCTTTVARTVEPRLNRENSAIVELPRRASRV